MGYLGVKAAVDAIHGNKVDPNIDTGVYVSLALDTSGATSTDGSCSVSASPRSAAPRSTARRSHSSHVPLSRGCVTPARRARSSPNDASRCGELDEASRCAVDLQMAVSADNECSDSPTKAGQMPCA